MTVPGDIGADVAPLAHHAAAGLGRPDLLGVAIVATLFMKTLAPREPGT
jgi:hypothetical protein